MKKYYKSYTQDKGMDDIKVVQETLMKTQKELSVKSQEVDMLKLELQDREEEIKALKEDKARILSE